MSIFNIKMKDQLSWNLNDYNQEFSLPKIKCLFNIKKNVNISIKEDQERWLYYVFDIINSKEKCKKYLSQQTFLIYCFSFPFASPNELKCIYKIIDWSFVIDDYYFETNKKDHSYIDEIFVSQKEKSKDIFIQLFWDIIDEYKLIGKQESINVLINEMYLWCKSAVQCNKNETISSTCSLNEYINSRYYDIGIIVALACSTTKIVVSNEIRSSKLFKKLEYWFVFCNTLINDFYSFNKEKNDKVLTNYVKIKTMQCGSINESLDYIAQQIEASLKEIEYLSNKLIQSYPSNSDLNQYVESLQYLTSGHLYVSSVCNRYNN